MAVDKYFSKSHVRKCECGDKKRHVTRKSAIIQLEQHALASYEPDATLIVYKCGFCHCWHIGHTDLALIDITMLEG